jgi:phosphoglycerate dehydrogenase-like enzyme
MRVVYTDPPWAIDSSGRLDPDRADVEHQIFGHQIEVEFGPYDKGFCTSGPPLIDLVAGAEGIVIYRCPVTPEVVTALAPTCRVVGRSGTGVDNLNAPLLMEAGICAFNIPDYCGDEVSTHAMALLLGLERGVCVQDRLVRTNCWEIYGGGTPRRTALRTVGIVGFGRIGRATARKIQPFYGRVLAVDPYVASDVMYSHGVTPIASVTELFSESDAVVLHTALTAETAGLVDASALAFARPGCLLVNPARGRLVDHQAVLDALKAGVLGGFASDVFSPEDPNQTPTTRELAARDDVVITCHRAFLSVESELSLRHRVARSIKSVLIDGVLPSEGQAA